jgi:hypothetical protein
MFDYFYKFESEEQAKAVLEPLGMTYTDEEGNVSFSLGGHQFAAWPVAEISGVEGWHYNLRVVDPEFDVSSLEQYAVFPRNPRCVFA